MSYDKEPIEANVAELKPRMKNITITFKVVEIGEAREVSSRRDMTTHRVADAIVGDSTGIVNSTTSVCGFIPTRRSSISYPISTR